MTWSDFVLICLMVTSSGAINRPVYKVVLSQKGFTQFLQYDVETPPLREFTFCTWIRIYDLSGDQSIFTYVANGDNRVVRLWLDSGGHFMRVSINGRVTSSAPVEFVKDVWRHVCLSYQSDYGAWAIYIDAKLVLCEIAQSLYGFVLPRGGSLIVGYGTADNGAPNGLDGEIFGANMLLKSTVERNRTTKMNHLFDQKAFNQNKIKSDDQNIKYVVLSDLQTDEIHNNFEKTPLPIINKTRSFIKLSTPFSHVEHDVGLDLVPGKSQIQGVSKENEEKEKEIFDFPTTNALRTTTENTPMNFWNLVNQAGQQGKFRIYGKKPKSPAEISGSSTRDLAAISEYETPPPPPTLPLPQLPQFGPPSQLSQFAQPPQLPQFASPPHQPSFASVPPLPSSSLFYFDKNAKVEKPTIPPKSIYLVNKDFMGFSQAQTKKITDVLSDVETPPPVKKDKKVYGQWTSSKFAGSVLNYLKSINYYNKDQKTPQTIPLAKNSDNYPYASEYKMTKLRPPLQFQRRKFMDRKLIKKRAINASPQINVQIVEEDLRSAALKQHAQTKPKAVEIINRGNPTQQRDRFYRNTDNQVSKESAESAEIYKPTPFKVKSFTPKNKVLSDYDLYKNNNLMTILPFLKSLEYFVDDSHKTGSENFIRSSEDDKIKKVTQMYSKSLSSGNKWHNVKSYNNDYTPRRINIDSGEVKSDIDAKIAEANKKHPSIRLKYKHEGHKVVPNVEDPAILKGRELAMSVSNQSNSNKDSISLVKYNHGFLPSHDKKLKNSEKIQQPVDSNLNPIKINSKNNFNKNVKLGNALNELHAIGYTEQQKKQSFVGGNEKIPDINRYRSEIDNEKVNVPSSLGLRACKNIDFDDKVLYVQPDLSIDTSHIISPVKKKNVAIEFIQQNYNKCSLDGSVFEKSYLLFINWSKTPVRLFGGAYPKTTTDLCGFFK